MPKPLAKNRKIILNINRVDSNNGPLFIKKAGYHKSSKLLVLKGIIKKFSAKSQCNIETNQIIII